MLDDKLDSELIRRIELVEQPDYEGEPLSRGDYFLLTFVGVIFPFIFMGYGWLL